MPERTPDRPSAPADAPGPWDPAGARRQAIRRLEECGFRIVARNGRGDSVYLAREGLAHTVRVSSHARTPRQRRVHPEVATSLVIRDTRSAAQVEAMVAAALRAYARALAPPSRPPAPAGP